MRNGLRFGEVVIAGDAATGIVYDVYDNECEARLDGEVIRAHPAAAVCARALAMQGVHLVWSFVDDKPVAAPPQRPQQPQTPTPAAFARRADYRPSNRHRTRRIAQAALPALQGD